ncbi:MAG: hypothetical protein BWX84_01558 [Verrucomicrobia bacterium ADurb.Bin118]|nr:MAG: hypothetical protein BWX84_01558 [Verrucomicrobia bacterium ADurb.Bin118]
MGKADIVRGVNGRTNKTNQTATDADPRTRGLACGRNTHRLIASRA